jgi:hypothetical protein
MDVTRRAKIAAAKREMADAEGDLSSVLKDIRIARRAEKTQITAVVEVALAKLKSAREAVEELEKLLADDTD